MGRQSKTVAAAYRAIGKFRDVCFLNEACEMAIPSVNAAYTVLPRYIALRAFLCGGNPG
jgi:hypothetical protein